MNMPKCPECGGTLCPPLDADAPDVWWCGDCDWRGCPLIFCEHSYGLRCRLGWHSSCTNRALERTATEPSVNDQPGCMACAAPDCEAGTLCRECEAELVPEHKDSTCNPSSCPGCLDRANDQQRSTS